MHLLTALHYLVTGVTVSKWTVLFFVLTFLFLLKLLLHYKASSNDIHG